MSDGDKIDYFMDQTNEQLKDIKDQLRDIKKQSDLLLNRYNFLWGGVIAISAAISFGITIVFGR